MTTSVVQSKTEQIAAILRDEIRRGKVPVGCKLSSVRTLAQRFGVSPRSIVVALEKLQQENLIVSEHGKGVYVKDRRDADIIEVFLLLRAKYDNSNAFLNMLLDMTLPPYLRRGFRFNIRCVYDETLSQDILERELRTIDGMGQVSCLLVNAAAVKACEFPLFAKMHIPTVFLGDFAHADLEKVTLNQIAGDDFMAGYGCLEFMQREGYRETVLLLQPLTQFFYRNFYNGIMKGAADFGIKVDYHELPDAENFPQGQNSLDMIKGIIDSIGPDRVRNTPAVIYGISPDEPAMFTREYRDENSPPWINPSHHPDGATIFFQAIFDRIEELVRGSSEPKRIKPRVTELYTDINTKKQWIFHRD